MIPQSPFRSPQKVYSSLLASLMAIFILIFTIFPVLLVISTALKERSRVIRDPLLPPTEFHWENFFQAWETGRFGNYFLNSIIVAIPTVILILLFGLLAAYAFAKMQFRGRSFIFIFFMVGLTIPLSVLIIPLFYEIRDMDLLSTPWALILPQVGLSMPFAILLLYSFIRELPGEILDAGLIDGCSRWQLLRYIVAPMSRPAIVTLLVFNFMWSWNNFLLPIILIHQDSARTLPIGLNAFRGRFLTDVPLLMAGAVISFMPVVIVYIIFQRQFIKGITAGALK